MSTEKNFPSEDENFNFYCIKGFYGPCSSRRMSPSSWDDSEEEGEEPTDTNSSSDFNHPEEKRFSEGLEEEDRRQSLARVRRRSRESDRACGSLGTPDTDPKIFASASWDDWNYDGITLGTENRLRFSLCSGSIFNGPECSSTRGDEINKGSRERADSHNLNVKLSRILEEEESKSNGSLGNGENSRSPGRTCNIDPENRRKDDGRKWSGESEATVVFSTEGDAEKDEDEKIRNGTRLRIKKKNSEFAINYEDCGYVNNTLAYFFGDGKEGKRRGSNFDERSLNCNKQIPRTRGNAAKIEANELFRSFREVDSSRGRKDAGDKISIDEVEDYGDFTDMTHESGTPRRHDNLTGRERDHAPSKESLELGLENLFCVTRPTFPLSSPSENYHDTVLPPGTDLLHEKERFNEEVAPSVRDARAFSSRRTRSESNGADSNKWQQLEEGRNLPEITLGENNEKEDSGDGDSSRKYAFTFHAGSGFGPGPTTDESDFSGKGWMRRNKSDLSLKGSVFIESDVSDKSSTTDAKTLQDSFCEIESSVTPESVRIWGCAISNDNRPSGTICKWSKTEKFAVTSFEADENFFANCNPLSVRDKLGFGDFGDNGWNTDNIRVKQTDCPQDRGDMKFESYSVKSEWEKLIAQLDERYKINKPTGTVFKIDAEENFRSNKLWQLEDCWENILNPKNSFTAFGKNSVTGRRASGKSGSYCEDVRRTKAKKRKRENAFSADTNTTCTGCPSDTLVSITGKSWLVNTLTTKRSMLTKGRGSLRTFLLMRSRRLRKKRRYNLQHPTSHFSDSSRKSFGCFQIVFKRFINLFTVLWRKRRK